MLTYRGKGASASSSDSHGAYKITNDKYDVYPMLVVGEESFKALSLRSVPDMANFDIKHHKPGTFVDRQDPTGDIGFIVIMWYYAFLTQRSERIAAMYALAEA